MAVVVREATVSEITDNENFSVLRAEYAAEASINGMPDPSDKMGMYSEIEKSGVFHAFAAFEGDKLVGFIATITPILPHYGVAVTVTESLFVGASYRKTGAGLKLIRAAEKHAKSVGSPGILISAPSGGTLAEILPKMHYRETNRVFFKEARYDD